MKHNRCIKVTHAAMKSALLPAFFAGSKTLEVETGNKARVRMGFSMVI